jgi:hypothetical protein
VTKNLIGEIHAHAEALLPAAQPRKTEKAVT